MKVLGVSGSLRADSYNTRLLEAAAAARNRFVLCESRRRLPEMPRMRVISRSQPP